MVNWYAKGQSQYTSGDFHMAFYIDINGYPEANYATQDIEGEGESGDPFMAFAIDTQTWVYGEAQVEIGLLGSYRFKADSTGLYGWNGSGWTDLLAAGGVENLSELSDVTIDGTPADNELLAWDTSAGKWINQTAAEAGLGAHPEDHDNTHHTTNYHTEVDGTGVATVHSDITSTGSQSIITTAERNALHTIYQDSAAVSAVESAGLTMGNPIAMGTNNITLDASQTVDGVDISAISITNMPTAVNNWKIYCTNGAGVMTEIATGDSDTVLTGNGLTSAPSFQAGGGGDNLGDHTATEDLEMSGNNVINVNNMKGGIESGIFWANNNFKDDADDTEPIGWTISEDSNTEVKIISSLDGHKKVLQLYDNNGAGVCLASSPAWTAVEDDIIEFWFRLNTITAIDSLQFILREGASTLIQFLFNQDDLRHYNGGYVYLVTGEMVADRWYHMKIICDDSANTFSVDLDGERVLTNSAYYNNSSVGSTHIYFITGIGSTCTGHIDALGNVSNPNYNEGDNYTPLINSGGITLQPTQVIASADEDLSFIFGRALLASPTTDIMHLSHRDMATTSNYAVSQNASGQTKINCATGQDITFCVSGADEIVFNNTSATFNGMNLIIANTTKTAGAFYGGSTDPTNTTRTNYDGYFYATKVYNALGEITGGGGAGTLAETLALGDETDGADIIIDSLGDLIVYSDDKVTEKLRIDGATGAITTPDGDITFTFGRMEAGPLWSDAMCISHRDMYTTANYALRQLAGGETSLNAPSASNVVIRINGSTKASVNTSALTMSVPIAMGTSKITGLGNGSSAQDAMAFGQKYTLEVHDNTEHDPDYEEANANIQSHVASPVADAHHAKWTTGDTETVITAEIVDGQSIDNAIDSLIGTHATDDNAHHEVIEQGDVDTSISTHASDDNAHHEVFESLVDDTTPTQGGPLDENEKGIELTTNLTANTTYSGIIAPYTVSGLTFGQLVYISGDHTCSLADANAVGTMPVVGMYVGTNKVLICGFARQDTWTWTAGQRIYCDGDGNPTATAPSATGDYIQVIGVANSADEIQVMPSLSEVKHT